MKKKFFEFQKKWYLKLYGFSDEQELESYLSKTEIRMCRVMFNIS
jgi:hypothetical protein